MTAEHELSGGQLLLKLILVMDYNKLSIIKYNFSRRKKECLLSPLIKENAMGVKNVLISALQKSFG